MNARTISKEQLVPTDAPGNGWYIIEAAGQHPTQQGDAAFTQNLTPEVLAAVAAAGVPAEGLPIDRDHLSLDSGNSTEAVGWVRELATCGGNLAARIEWTALGLPLVQGRIYKHFSTVYPAASPEQVAAGSYEPQRLIGLALTNQPNNRDGQPPITNTGRNTPSPGNEELPTITTPNQNTDTNMQYSAELLAALGLAEGATDAEVLAAVQELKEQNATANAAAKQAEAAEAEAVINAAEKENGVTLTDEEKQEAKEHIITNRAHGLKYVGLLCRDKRAAAPVENTERRYAGKTPVLTNRAAADPEQAIANRAQQLCDEARKAGKPIGYFVAVEKARAEKQRSDSNNI